MTECSLAQHDVAQHVWGCGQRIDRLARALIPAHLISNEFPPLLLLLLLLPLLTIMNWFLNLQLTFYWMHFLVHPRFSLGSQILFMNSKKDALNIQRQPQQQQQLNHNTKHHATCNMQMLWIFARRGILTLLGHVFQPKSHITMTFGGGFYSEDFVLCRALFILWKDVCNNQLAALLWMARVDLEKIWKYLLYSQNICFAS